MSSPIDATVLRGWGLPEPGASKKSRGRVLVVGGSRRSPGAVMLAGEAALRVGAGRLGLVVPASIDAQLAVMVPEAAVMSLPPHASDPMIGTLGDELAAADAVLVGPGFDNADETAATLVAVADTNPGCLVLDAYAIGVLPRIDRGRLPAALVLNANEEEAAILLDREPDGADDVLDIARRFDAVVHCYGTVAAPDGSAWQVPDGGPGLGTSGSGDVLAGAIAGFAARGVPPERAAVWGSWTHGRAGERLTEQVGIGFLARDLLPELTPALRDTVTG